jgi:hypothetical protein
VSASLKEKLSASRRDIGGRKIEKINRIDGVKSFSRTAVDADASVGDRTLVRIYAETEKKEDLEVLLEQGRNYLLG